MKKKQWRHKWCVPAGEFVTLTVLIITEEEVHWSIDDHGQQLLQPAAVSQLPGQKEQMGGSC